MDVSRLRLRDARGEELRALLAPVRPETFVHEYWAKKPLFVKGFAGKYEGFFDAEMFSRALTAAGPASDDFLRASFDRKTPEGTSAAPRTPGELQSSAFRATPDQAVALFDAGATLCMSQVETRVPSLGPFIAAIKRQLGFPSKVSFNAYLSPAASGYNWHFDSRIASTLQIEGTKVWRFSNTPAIPWPRANGSLRADGTPQYADPSIVAQSWETLAAFDTSDTSEVLLEPGDLLILPAGLWHEACGGAGGSLALNLSFTPISYTLLVRNLLDKLLTPEAGWRSPGPVLPIGAPGEVDPDGIAAISEQLARAASTLQALSGDSSAVVRLWESYVQSVNPGIPAAPEPRVAPAAIEPTQRLRVRPDDNLCAMLADGGSTLCMNVGTGRELELSGVAVHFVQRLLTEREFVAGDCRSWSENGTLFEWDDVATMLTSLQREGLLQTVSGEF